MVFAPPSAPVSLASTGTAVAPASWATVALSSTATGGLVVWKPVTDVDGDVRVDLVPILA